jgi:hypothetical protein
MSSTPEAATSSMHAAGYVLLTAQSVTSSGERPFLAAASATRSRIALALSAMLTVIAARL